MRKLVTAITAAFGTAFVGTALFGSGAMAGLGFVLLTEPVPAVAVGELSANDADLPIAFHARPLDTDRGFAPPAWFPEPERRDLFELEYLDGAAEHRWGPKVRAWAGILADLDSGKILWARDPDSPRSIASTTKLVSALAVVSEPVDLDREVCMTVEQWPTRSGARSKFETGDCHSGWEYLGGALVASDNRGAFAFPSIAGVEYYAFLERMQTVATDIGMRGAMFADPAGLEDENMASARDVLKAVTAVSHHPQLAHIASAPTWRIDTARGPRHLGTTNRLLALSLAPPKKRFTPPPYEALAAKTGYTDTAKFCFATVVRSLKSGRRFAAVQLGAPTSGARFDDTLDMLQWAERQ